MPVTQRQPVTHKQIADALGISRQSVGFALRDDSKVSREMRQRVQQAAEELGYEPEANQAARVLVARRHGHRVLTGIIGCSFSGASGQRLPYNVHLQEGVEAVTRREHVDVMLLHPAQNSGASGWDKLDGILFHGPGARSVFPNLPGQLPVVSLMAPEAGGFGVIADEEQGVREAMEYLLKLGHRRIAYLIDTKNYLAQLESRLNIYRHSLQAAGIAPDPRWVTNLFPTNVSFMERGRQSMAAWLHNGWRDLGCTALLVQNDRAAIGAMAVLREAGIRVPEDLSVIGFDSTDECDFCHPALTSIKIPLFDIGQCAAELLLQCIREQVVRPEMIVLPTRLEVRGSTAAPGARS